ncbi:TPA: hypothetical protein ACGG79_003341, partial [Vibrio cholerae]
MKLSAITLALILASTSASANITTFGTKNNTYTPPKPSIDTIPGEIKDRIIQCPTTKDPLPIWVSGASTRTLQFDLNVNVLVGKQNQSFKYSPTYSDIYINRNESTPAFHYGYIFDPNYNYVSNNLDFHPYGGGYSPWLAHTIYGNYLYRPGVPDTDKMPIFLSNTRKVRLNSNDLITLPNKDFSVSDVIFFAERFDINQHSAHETLYKILRSNNDPVIIGRASIYKNGNNLIIRYWFWSEWAQPYDTIGYSSSNNAEYKERNIMSNFSYNGRDITGYHVINDVRKLKDIRFLIRRTDKNKAGIWGIANMRGSAPWNVVSGEWKRDNSLSQQDLIEENKFYSEN